MMSLALPEIFLSISGMVLLVMGALKGNKSTMPVTKATIGFFVMALLFLFWINWDSALAFRDMFIMDQFAGVMKMLILLGLIVSLAMSLKYIRQENIARFEYPILMLFAGVGMMLMVSAHSLLTLYVALELQSLALYVLAAFKRHNVRSSEAGVKYFVLGALASGMLLFGISLIYGYTGSIDFGVIHDTLAASGAPIGVLIGMVFLLVGLAFKISAVPFHMWTPDVYQGVPTSVTAFFAIVPKVAAMGLLIRVLYEPFSSMTADWQQVIYFLSMASMAVGAFAGLMQTNIKRLMAYSSISNMGYALIGVVVGTDQGIGAVILYLAIYMVMTAGVFAIILMMRLNDQAADDIDDLAGMSRNHPMLAYGLAILMFSMMGIPPLAGFFGKLIVFNAAVDQGFYVLAVFGVITSVVAAYYYLRIIRVMFFDEPADKFDGNIGFSLRAVVFLSVAFVTLFILAPSTLIEMSKEAALVFFVS